MKPRLVLDESSSTSLADAPSASILELDNPRGAQTVADALASRLATWPHAGDVTVLHVKWGSTLSALEPVRSLPRLRTLSIVSDRIADLAALAAHPHLRRLHIRPPLRKALSLDVLSTLKLETLELDGISDAQAAAVGACASLRNLTLWRPKVKTLVALRDLRLTTLQLTGGSILTLAGIDDRALWTLDVRRCTKLSSLGGVRADIMDIWACNRLPLADLGPGTRPWALTLTSQQAVDDLSFVSGLTGLKTLTVCGGTKIARLDTGPLIDSRSLRAVHIIGSGFDDELAERMATSNPRLAVSNGHVAYDAGHPCSQEQFHERLHAIGDERARGPARPPLT